MDNNKKYELEPECQKTKKGRTKKQIWIRRMIRIDIVIVVLVSMYLTVAYSHIPFIEKWRTLYIETAMTTMRHQWLATLFFPSSVIDEVMERYYAQLDAQQSLESSGWEETPDEPEKEPVNYAEEIFFMRYWELDSPSVHKYFQEHPMTVQSGYDNIIIEDFDQKLGLYTCNGDPICVINTANDLIIICVSGNGYQGKLAICKKPEYVSVAKSKHFGSYGQELSGFCESNNAILSMNASRFMDIGGHGTGAEVIGSLIVDGVEYGNRPKKYGMKFVGFKKDNRMYICNYSSVNVSEYRWGVEGIPALIIDGESVVEGSFGMGIQPRSCIGQTQTGDVLMLIIDGRQPGHSLGCTIADCTDILLKYRCYQAMNLDGGSSAAMYYNGNYITKSSSASGRGRYTPDAIIVKKAAT